MKVSQARDNALEYLVAKSHGQHAVLDNEEVCTRKKLLGHTHLLVWKTSTDWAQGGAIIERERISVWARGNEWAAESFIPNQQGLECVGPTPLIAAMRCYVTSKLGEEVDVPEKMM